MYPPPYYYTNPHYPPGPGPRARFQNQETSDPHRPHSCPFPPAHINSWGPTENLPQPGGFYPTPVHYFPRPSSNPAPQMTQRLIGNGEEDGHRPNTADLPVSTPAPPPIPTREEEEVKPCSASGVASQVESRVTQKVLSDLCRVSGE